MRTIKIFIASSSELADDREDFRLFISKENDRLHKQDIYLQIVQWENFLDSISDTRLQDEYNKAIGDCDIVLCLFFTKVGKYSAEEFNTAYQLFKNKGKPKIWTYFKNAAVNTGSITDEINTLLSFKKQIAGLGHFHTEYNNIDNLINQYRTQLDKFLSEAEGGREVVTDSVVVEKQAPAENNFNVLLSKKLIDAIRKYNRKADEFLTLNNDWQTNNDLIQTAKRIIISGYVGVLGIQLRKLMSIGEEDFSESKMRRYLENSQITAKRCLQLICFGLLSALWDYKSANDCKISQAHSDALKKFFKNAAEEGVNGFAALLRALTDIFADNKIKLPFPELATLHADLQPGKELSAAAEYLHSLTEMLTGSSYTAKDCAEAEKNIVVILEKFSFLAAYKIVSIKDIDYSFQRNDTAGSYLHNYFLLEGGGQHNNSQEKVRKENTPLISYAVLLVKDNLRQYLNLVPFVIDYNALGFSGGSKICLYAFRNTYDDLDLNYSFIEDNSKVTVKKSKNPKPAGEQAINNWLANPANRKDMNFDNVITLFNEAKRILTGLEEEAAEDTI